jgi:ketopantoate reductase
MSFRIAIVGSGAIGSYYGAKLAYGGSNVHFLMRGDLRAIRSAGLCIRGAGENFRLSEVNCYNSTKEIGPCDLVLISVKATSNLDLVELEIEPIWGEPVRRDTVVGANVPRLEIVYALLKSLGEAERREKSAAKIPSHSS